MQDIFFALLKNFSKKLLLILTFAFIYFSGCISVSLPSNCLTAQSKIDCVYKEAVLSQNPFYCYSISDISKRKICIQDAINPSMQKLILLNQNPEEQNAPANEMKENNQKKQNQTQPNNTLFLECSGNLDECISKKAEESNNISLCTLINSSERSSCIIRIAKFSRNVSICEVLSEGDKILCVSSAFLR